MKTLFRSVAALAVAAAAPAAAECGSVTIAEMNWASAQFAAQVDKIVLEEAYGCDVTVVTGDTMPTMASMTEKGEPDIAPEMWPNSIGATLEEAIAEGLVVKAALIIPEASEGWWIPAYTRAAHPEIQTIDDALARPDLFVHPEYSDLGAVYGCPSGWACQHVNINLFRAWGGEEKGFELVDPGSSAGLDGSLAHAYERGQPWLGYYWTPSGMIAKYDMVLLDFGVPFDAERWESCLSQPDCQDPQRSAWTKPEAYTVVAGPFAESAPEAMDWLRKRAWPNAVIHDVLLYMEEGQYQGEDAAWYFLEKYEDVWSAWLSEEAAAKVKAAL